MPDKIFIDSNLWVYAFSELHNLENRKKYS